MFVIMTVLVTASDMGYGGAGTFQDNYAKLLSLCERRNYRYVNRPLNLIFYIYTKNIFKKI